MDEFAPPFKKIRSETMSDITTLTDLNPVKQKPFARSVEEFLEQPNLFSPKPEYLANTFIEVYCLTE